MDFRLRGNDRAEQKNTTCHSRKDESTCHYREVRNISA